MKYVMYINELIKEKLAQHDEMVVFGQNVNAGSCLSGLTRNLELKGRSVILNTQNSENSLCGVGFGLMINKVPSVLFLKQQDFLVLGIDHMINTYNVIRRNGVNGSFTIFTPVIDCGYQGLQSSLNNFADFCSIARVSGYTITNKIDAEKIINMHLVNSGFRIIGVSQRLYGSEILEPALLEVDSQCNIFQYYSGKDATIVCFNFSFPQGFELYKQMKLNGIEASLFSVNSLTPVNWDRIILDTKSTNNLVVLDDSKSANLSCNSLIKNVLKNTTLRNNILLKRDLSGDWLNPNEDKLVVDCEEIIKKIKIKV